MDRPVLEIKNLKASAAGVRILNGINLTVKGGEIHALMGPNGSGKSTLSSVIMGHPDYTVEEGEVLLNGENLLEKSVDERARAGMFLALQYPVEISGVTNSQFLRTAINARRDEKNPIPYAEFVKKMRAAVKDLEMNENLPKRYLNEGFSGGEKKSNEILQMKLLNPSVAILDEIDSGLDIDAVRIVGSNVSDMVKEREGGLGVIVITHYQRLLDYIKPDFVHVLSKGKIIKSGGCELVSMLEKEGYSWIDAYERGAM